VITLGIIVTCVPIIPLLWALVRFGENHAARLPASCESRLTSEGFIGNSDFYGLGIRIGIYLQWASSVISHLLFPETGRALAGAQTSLSIALSVAVLLLIFQRDCTFTAEMMVIFHLMIAGFYISNFGHLDFEQGTPNPRWHNLRGLNLTTFPIRLIALPVAAWFWIRIASAGEVDFVHTPGGTSAFLFAHIRGDSFHRVAAVFAFFSIWRLVDSLVVGPISDALLSRFERTGRLIGLLSWQAVLVRIVVYSAAMLESLLVRAPILRFNLPKRVLVTAGDLARYENRHLLVGVGPHMIDD